MISFCFPFQFIHKLKTYFRHSFTNSFFFLFQLFHSIFSKFTSTMARPIESVMDINDSKDLWKIVVRCRHLWTVRSSSNKEHLELILVDSKLDMIQAIVPSHLVSKYVGDLAVGASYIMQNFKVSNNDFSFKSTTHGYKLVFCGLTYVKKTELPEIPIDYFNILGLASIADGKFQPNVLVDIVGGVTEILQTQINSDNNKSKFVFMITDMSVHYGAAQGGFPLNVSNAWSGTKLIINDISNVEIKKLKDSLNAELPKLSSSSLQVETTQTSQYSDFDKFIWKAEVISLAEIAMLKQETTCFTIAKLEKFEVGNSGWYYDGCAECTKSVTVKDGKLKCYANHISSEPVPRYKLEVLGVDGKFKSRFVFWDSDCFKLIGKSALQMKNELVEAGEDNPLEFPFGLDAMLKKELAIRAVFQPKFNRLSVISFKDDEDSRKKVKDTFKSHEDVSKIPISLSSSQDDMKSLSEPLSVSADFDPNAANSVMTPCKRINSEASEDVESVQLSSTKTMKPVKKEDGR
ncbi:hypothetical protein KIW84_012389 [Lathyrus oleraceus]|uniref:Replication protein A 70 kDa DNA-binding subunit B/D first OB fold domain-containing protein n=1 Tax=Pisum sativum TaxID=3888 RepID=A0A9D5BHE2_PEA|nr:hypothetical protein KIW84_012389 [Pisum sativum]